MAEVAYMLLLDGIGVAIATSEEVTDAYVQGLGFDRCHHGLRLPSGLACAVEPRNGMLDGADCRFVIDDVDGTLPQVFAADEDAAQDLLELVEAGTAALGSTLYDKHVGVEKIGSAGERRRHSCVPGFNVGLRHISEQQASFANGSPSPVSDTPVVWAGRRFCFYRLVKSGGAWPDLTDAEERRAAAVHWGTLTAQAQQDGRVWTIPGIGIESWPSKSLGAGFTQEPQRVLASITLNEDANEHVLVGWLDLVNLFDETDQTRTYAPQTVDDTLLSGATTYEEVAEAVNTFLEALADSTDSDEGTAYSSFDNNGLRYSTAPDDDGIQIRWSRSAEYDNIPSRQAVRLRLLCSAKVYKILGYDPKVQGFVDPITSSYVPFENSPLNVDYPAHALGIFWSANPAAMAAKLEGKGFANAEETNSFGDWRRWVPIYVGGTNVFDTTQVGQTFQIQTFEPFFLPSSSAAPLPADPTDASSVFPISGVGDVTHQGIVALSGPYRDEGDPEAEVVKISIPVRVGWKQNSDGSVATDGQWPVLVVYDWPAPRLYGFADQRPTLWGSWRAPPADGEPTTVRPLLVLEGGPGSDVVAAIFAQTLASTGTAGAWYSDPGLTTPRFGLEGPRYLDVGVNDLGLSPFGDEGLGRHTDAESSTFGFGIPASMVASASPDQGNLEGAIAEQAESDLYRCKIALGKVASAREVLATLLDPTGYAVSMAGGRYGVFDPFRFAGAVDGAGLVTEEDLRGMAGEPGASRPKQRLRLWSPLDRVEIEARLDPNSGEYARTETRASADPHRAYRAQSIKRKVDGAHLIWPAEQGLVGSGWLEAFATRWTAITRWWTRQHFEVTFPVPLRRHLEFWPGASISITNRWLVNPSGRSYGVTLAPGYVIGRVADCRNELLEVRAIVDASQQRLYAPAVKATEYRPDTDGQGYRIFVEDDYLGIRSGTGTLDVEGFVEPDRSDVGGNASIEGLAFDGVSFTGGIYGTVESVNAEAGNCWIKLTGALTGATWYRDRHHVIVLREATNQAAAWVPEVYAPIGDEDGNYVGSTKSPRFKD